MTRDTLDALLERILPGSVAAGVRRYVERVGAVDLVGDLAELEALGFAALPAADQDAIVASLEGGQFFELLRRHALEGMFGDPRWGGNADGAGWDLLGYPGPRLEWDADEQRVEVVR
jgi:gluconate 2-dehydrogenase gamma chain